MLRRPEWWGLCLSTALGALLQIVAGMGCFETARAKRNVSNSFKLIVAFVTCHIQNFILPYMPCFNMSESLVHLKSKAQHSVLSHSGPT